MCFFFLSFFSFTLSKIKYKTKAKSKQKSVKKSLHSCLERSTQETFPCEVAWLCVLYRSKLAVLLGPNCATAKQEKYPSINSFHHKVAFYQYKYMFNLTTPTKHTLWISTKKNIPNCKQLTHTHTFSTYKSLFHTTRLVSLK